MNSAISKKPAKTCQIQFLQMSQLLATHLNSPSTKTQKNATSFRGFSEVIFGGIVCKVIQKYCFFLFLLFDTIVGNSELSFRSYSTQPLPIEQK